MSACIEPCGFLVCRRWVFIELCLHQQHAVILAALEILSTITEAHMHEQDLPSHFVLSLQLLWLLLLYDKHMMNKTVSTR